MSDPRDLSYRNHPAVRAGMTTYGQLKRRAKEMKKASDMKMSEALQSAARQAGFQDLFHAQRFYAKFTPEAYAKTKSPRRKA